MTFPYIFSPVSLRHKTLRNRIVFGAHTTNMAVNGVPTEQHVAYYRERALGGAAMIVVEPMPVHAAAVLTRGNFYHSNDDVIPHFRKLTEASKSEGAVILQQLYHVGAQGDADNSWHPNWSPSGGPSYHDSDGSHAMTEAEIEESIESFIQAARRCQAAGFDGVEVWAAYHALLDQFWTPFSNKRDDRWGGSLENRTRFSREIMRRIRKQCGEKFIIGMAVSDEPDVSVALCRESIAEIIALHDHEQAMDYVTCGSGSYFDFYKLMPTFLYGENLGSDLARILKEVTQHSLVTAESHIRTPENAETVLSADDSDLVSIVRGQIADPHLVNKAKENRSDDIRRCISCNQMCWGRRSRDYWISCLVNPSAGREYQWESEHKIKSTNLKSVLVVGGGPAGLEAARVSAARGHHVVLAEATPNLGGQFRLAGLQPRRNQITELINWYSQQIKNLGVDIRYNCYMGIDEIVAFAADKTILATGSLPAGTGFQKAIPHLARLPGMETGNVWSIEDVMMGTAELGKRVIVLDEGGNWHGCGTAWKLADNRHEVSIITPDSLIGKELQRSAADVPLRRTLATLGVRFITETVIAEWGVSGAKTLNLLTGAEDLIIADSLVLATVNTVDNDLPNDLISHGIDFYLIGDAAAPRQAAYAIYEGKKVALTI